MSGQKILRIDLSTRAVQEQTVSAKDGQYFLGGRALAAMLLYREVPKGTDPLGPGNKLIFSTGPLSGTGAYGSHHTCVTTKSPLTGLYLDALSSGHFSRDLKSTGYDLVVIEGRSEERVYVVISENAVSFKPADTIWGMATDDAQRAIAGELHLDRLSTAVIGPAGERLVPYAGIVSEERIAARGGGGAVMGSKNFKALVVAGSRRRVLMHDQALFAEAMKMSAKGIAAVPMLSRLFPNYGTTASITQRNADGGLVIRNFQEGHDDAFEAISGPEMEKRGLIVKSRSCAPPCPAKCTKVFSINQGKYAPIVTRGPEYETLYSLGTCCGISDPEAVIYGELLCNRMGLDSMSAGVSIAFAMECYERGILGQEETGGIDLRFGNGDILAPLIQDIAFQRGFGATLSLGVRKMAELFGKGSERFAMHAKGLELGGYDPRTTAAMSLVYACGPRGGCHHAGGFPAMDPSIKGKVLDAQTEAAVVKKSRDRRVVCDSAILCTFLTIGIKDDMIRMLIKGTTGADLSVDELYAIGDRGSNVERAFNVREGLVRAWDTLPPRLTGESLDTGNGTRPPIQLDPLLDAFYSVCGWDVKTGAPTKSKLTDLGLTEIADDLYGN